MSEEGKGINKSVTRDGNLLSRSGILKDYLYMPGKLMYPPERCKGMEGKRQSSGTGQVKGGEHT